MLKSVVTGLVATLRHGNFFCRLAQRVVHLEAISAPVLLT